MFRQHRHRRKRRQRYRHRRPRGVPIPEWRPSGTSQRQSASQIARLSLRLRPLLPRHGSSLILQLGLKLRIGSVGANQSDRG